jgi:hypothetical protein
VILEEVYLLGTPKLLTSLPSFRRTVCTVPRAHLSKNAEHVTEKVGEKITHEQAQISTLVLVAVTDRYAVVLWQPRKETI